MTISDLLIIGGGPAGMSAAINGASEGLTVRMLDNGMTLGGQAKESSGIENYPGFPDGITGSELMSRMARQARKFAAGVLAPVSAMSLQRETDGLLTVIADDYSEYRAKAVLLSLGLSYRRLQADNVGHFLGKGVFYGVPAWKPKAHVKTVAVIGGANSAGQAVCGLSKNSRLDVKLLIRKTIADGMSQYLIDRIKEMPNVEVIEMCEVTECRGGTCLQELVGVKDGKPFNMAVDDMYVFIGAVPKTFWLRGAVDCDDKNFILTGQQRIPDDKHPGSFIIDHVGALPYETTLKGVFAAGDVRSGSTKRIATSIGEGAAALQMVHKYLAENHGG